MRISSIRMAGALVAGAACGSANAAIIAAWDFQTTTNGGTAVVQSSSSNGALSPNRYVANFGTGTLYLDGTNGSSSFTQTNSAYEITAFSGTATNADTSIGMSTAADPFSALAIRKGSLIPAGANGKGMVFKFSMSGLESFSISYVTARPSSSGFTSQVLEYSTDGSTWSSLGTHSPSVGNFPASTVTSFSTAGLDGAATSYVRLKVSGATSTAGDVRFDNFILSATAVPAPGAVALLGVAGLVGARRRRA
jgi:MYXO-CTERM domain-containing protein